MKVLFAKLYCVLTNKNELYIWLLLPKNDVEVATFGKIPGNFSPIVPPSAAGVRSRRFRRGGHLVAGVGTF